MRRLNRRVRTCTTWPVSEEPRESLWSRGLAYAKSHRSRLARFAVAIALVYAVTDLLSSAPQDATLSLPLDAPRREARAAGEPGDEVAITVFLRGSDEALTHTRRRVEADDREISHAVHLSPGPYTVSLEMAGATPREGHFEIPAEGVVRVRWRATP